MDDDIEIWELPSWAADTIQETLAMDATSNMFEPAIRAEIEKADQARRTITPEFQNMESSINEVIEILWPKEPNDDLNTLCWEHDSMTCACDVREALDSIKKAIARCMAPTD